jgi:hypothetical protein
VSVRTVAESWDGGEAVVSAAPVGHLRTKPYDATGYVELVADERGAECAVLTLTPDEAIDLAAALVAAAVEAQAEIRPIETRPR